MQIIQSSYMLYITQRQSRASVSFMSRRLINGHMMATRLMMAAPNLQAVDDADDIYNPSGLVSLVS